MWNYVVQEYEKKKIANIMYPHTNISKMKCVVENNMSGISFRLNTYLCS